MNKSNKKQLDHKNEPAMIGIRGDGTQPPTHDPVKLQQWYVNKNFCLFEFCFRSGFYRGYCKGLEDPKMEKNLNDWYYLSLNEYVNFPNDKIKSDSPHVQMKFRKGFCQGFRVSLKNYEIKKQIDEWRYSDCSKIIIPPGHEFAGHIWGVKN